jgi:hypothetical protein
MKNQNYPTFTRLQVCCIPLDFTSVKRYQLFMANAKLIDNLRINDLCYFCRDAFAWDLYMLHGLQAINQPRSNGGSALLRKLARRFGQHQSEGKRSTCLFNTLMFLERL